MFNAQKVYEKYGISGLIMPYLWLIIYIYFHYVIIGLWFSNPGIIEYISLIVHVVLTIIAIIFSHQVLLWAAQHKDNGAVSNFFSAIIRKMSDSPIEIINGVVEPIINEEYETSTKVIKFIYYLLYTLISLTFGYIIFIIVAIMYMITYLIERRNSLVK